jgi:hypothetical protein
MDKWQEADELTDRAAFRFERGMDDENAYYQNMQKVYALQDEAAELEAELRSEQMPGVPFRIQYAIANQQGCPACFAGPEDIRLAGDCACNYTREQYLQMVADDTMPGTITLPTFERAQARHENECTCYQYHSAESGQIEDIVCDNCKDDGDEIPYCACDKPLSKHDLEAGQDTGVCCR